VIQSFRFHGHGPLTVVSGVQNKLPLLSVRLHLEAPGLLQPDASAQEMLSPLRTARRMGLVLAQRRATFMRSEVGGIISEIILDTCGPGFRLK